MCRFVRAGVDWCAFFPIRPFVAVGRLRTGVRSAKSCALIISVTAVTQHISLVAPDSSNHDKENVMPRFKHVFSLILAASMLVASAYSEAATIRYDVTNATTVQNGYSLSGYIEVSGTGTLSSLSSFNLTATKAANPTITIGSGGPASYANVIGLIATDSALYVPDGSALQVSEGANGIDWINDLYGMNFYKGTPDYGANGWSSGSYPLTDGNSWQIGSVQAAASSVPEIDPNSLGSVLALVLGSLGLLERRRLQLTATA